MNLVISNIMSIAFGMSCLLAASGVQGAEVLWNGSTSPDWNTGANWVGNAVPGANDVAVFDPSQQAITRWNFRLSGNAAVSGIRFTNLTSAVKGDTLGAFTLTIGTNGVEVSGKDLTLAMPCVISADQRWTVASGSELMSAGELSGSAKLTKAGAGRVWLTGTSRFTGEYRIAEGILKGAVFAAPVMDGLEVWMDAAALATLSTNASGQVTNWVDKAGGQVMTPVGAGGGPLYGATIFNGRPGLRFNKDLVNGMLMESGYANTTNVVTSFVMMQRRTLQASYARVLTLYQHGTLDYNNSAGAVLYSFDQSAPFYSLSAARNGEGATINISTETPVCLMSRFNGVSLTLVQDGVIAGSVVSSAALANSFNANRLSLGIHAAGGTTYNTPLNGDVAEVLVYNRVLTATEEQQVTEYLIAKWKPITSVQDVLKDATLWFDASKPETLVTNAQGVVTAWNNLVSETKLAPLTAASCPIFVSQSVNGLPAVRFDKDVLNGLETAGGYACRGDKVTLFVSLVPRDSQTQYAGVASILYWVNGWDWNVVQNAALMNMHDTAGRYWGATRASYGVSSAWVTPGKPVVAMSRFDGVQHTFAFNGDVVGTPVASQGNFDCNCFRLGCRYEASYPVKTFNGDIQEALLFNRRLSPAEEQLVTAYLDAKWVAATNINDILVAADVHLDASAATSISANETGNVTNWVNIAGSSVLTVPTGAFNGPVLVEGGMNGLPILRFTAAQNTALVMQAGYSNTTAQVTAFIAMKTTGSTQGQYAGILSIFNSGLPHDYDNSLSAILAYYPSTSSYMMHGQSGNLKAGYSDIPPDAPFCWNTVYNGLANTLSLNNGAVTSVATAGNFNSDRLCLGSRYENWIFKTHFSGDVAEVLIYNRALSQKEKQMISDYLEAKWMPKTAASELTPLLQSAKIWLDASAAETLVTDGNGYVTAWSNRIDNTAKALLPPSGLKGPSVLANGMNGKPVLRFDKDLATKQSLRIDNGFSITGTAATAVIMLKPRSTQSPYARLANLWKDNNVDHNDIQGGIFGYFFDATSLRGNRVGDKSSVTVSIETPTCIISRFDGSNHRMIQNLTLSTLGASTGAFNANRFGLGASTTGTSEYFNGDIAEVLLFDYALNPDQAKLIYDYLQTKWVTPQSTGVLAGTQPIQISSAGELDVRDVNGLTLQTGVSLAGAGKVVGTLTVSSNALIQALSEGADHTLSVTGDLTFRSGSRVAIDYASGAPWVSVSGLLTLPSGITFSATNLVDASYHGKVPVLKGSDWDDGAGGSPASATWLLQGVRGNTTFLLNESDFSVNLFVRHGTLISFQ